MPSFEEIVNAVYQQSLNQSGKKYGDKPYSGALPVVRSEPCVLSEAECKRRTQLVFEVINEKLIDASKNEGVQILLGDIALNKNSLSSWKDILADPLVSDVDGCESEPIQVAFGDSIMHRFPRRSFAYKEYDISDFASKCKTKSSKFVLSIGQPSNLHCMAFGSHLSQILQNAYDDDNLAIITSSNSCILPIGTQVQTIVGIDSHALVTMVKEYIRTSKTKIGWSHGVGTKLHLLHWIHGDYENLSNKPLPAPLTKDKLDKTAEPLHRNFLHFNEYFDYLNNLQTARPNQKVANYIEVGLTVSILTSVAANAGVGLLLEQDCMGTLNEGSIGHTLTKMVQISNLESLRKQQAIYNFFTGDGACRLNGGIELFFDLINKARTTGGFTPLLNLFVFHNESWAVEDSLVGKNDEEHKLFNADFYESFATRPQCTVVKTEAELAVKLAQLTEKFDKYTRAMESGHYDPNEWLGKHLELIIVQSTRNIPFPPPLFGDLSKITDSDEFTVFKDTLGYFAQGCKELVPIYGCSAFEYIQYLDIFLSENSDVSRKYEYCCAKTDIQAAQLFGFEQPEGKAILMINDVYGINSLGESIRLHMQRATNTQVIVFIWHPMLLNVMDLFTVHRLALVWSNLGPHFASYFVNNQKDLFIHNLIDRDISPIVQAIDKGTKLIIVNMVPPFIRNTIGIDARIGL